MRVKGLGMSLSVTFPDAIKSGLKDRAAKTAVAISEVTFPDAIKSGLKVSKRLLTFGSASLSNIP